MNYNKNLGCIMFQQFLESVKEKYLRDTFVFSSEVDLVRPILEDEKFRKSFEQWTKDVQKVRNEGPAINDIDSTKTQSTLLSRIRKCKNLFEKYHLCNRSLVNLHACTHNLREIQSKIYYERANILLKTENYYEALQSLMMVVTETDDIKIFYRKALCGFKLNDDVVFNENIIRLREFYEEFDSYSDNVKQEIEKYRLECDKLFQKEVISSSESTVQNSNEFLEKYKNISIKITPEKGRHILSDDCIDVDSNILKEKAFAFVPLRTKAEKNASSYDCHNCAKTNIVPILCAKCCQGIYCSVDCLHKHEKIHSYECRGYQLWLWYEVGIAFLAFRVFLEGFGQFKSLIDESFDGKSLEQILQNSVEVEFCPERDQYRLLVSLSTHFEDTCQKDLVTLAMTACALTLYLRTESNFFEDKSLSADHKKWEVLISSFILRHTGQMIVNAHTISDIRLEYNGNTLPLFNNFSQFEFNRAGIVMRNDETFAAIFPFISLLNHSCKANIRNCFDGNFLTICSTDYINKSKEIFNSYGINYLRISKVDRRAILQDQYHFCCNCEECEKTEDEFLNLQRLRCFHCRSILDATFDMESMEVTLNGAKKCTKCDTSFNVEKFNSKIRFMAENIDEIHNINVLKDVLKAIKYCTQCVNQNHEVIYFFSKSLLNSSGNFDQTFQKEFEMIAKNMLNICGYLYGKNSLEYLLDQVCAMQVLADNGKNIIKHAKKLLSNRSFAIFKNIYESVLLKSA